MAECFGKDCKELQRRVVRSISKKKKKKKKKKSLTEMNAVLVDATVLQPVDHHEVIDEIGFVARGADDRVFLPANDRFVFEKSRQRIEQAETVDGNDDVTRRRKIQLIFDNPRGLPSTFRAVRVMQHRPFDCKPTIDSEADGDPNAGELKPDDAGVDVGKDLFMESGRIKGFTLFGGRNRRIDGKDQSQQ